ncbi:MAG: DNA cytosine methyltransferase [bacterium]|nr:DNA cytosine methyltransferase [bacterium]
MSDDPTPRPTALSVCSGIGGLDLAVREVLDARVVGHIERDAYCQAVLLARMEEEALEPAPVFPDLCSFDGRDWAGCVDLVFGGIPCQAHSVAGKQLRSADERDLVTEFLRLVGEVGPRLVFVENVRGFIAGDGLGRLLGGLAELGLDAEWGALSACALDAPHTRTRVFILAHTQRNGLEGLQPAGTTTGAARRSRWRDPYSGALRIPDGAPPPVDRLRAIGNAVVPAQAAAALRILLERIGGG